MNIFGVPDTVSSTSQFVPDIKEIVTDLYWTMTMTTYFKACKLYMILLHRMIKQFVQLFSSIVELFIVMYALIFFRYHFLC